MLNPEQLASVDDPELWSAMQKELQRHEDHVELIASEDYASPAVLRIQGSVLTDKYPEGSPVKHYYVDRDFVDIAEQFAIDRARQPFEAEYGNVQLPSDSQAVVAGSTCAKRGSRAMMRKPVACLPRGMHGYLDWNVFWVNDLEWLERIGEPLV